MKQRFTAAQRLAWLGPATLALTLLLPATARPARAPSVAERTAITRALPASLRKVPAGCVWIDIHISSTPRWASATPRWLVGATASDPCLRYAADGRYLLHRQGATWRIVFDGSDQTPCRLKAPRDLGACQA